MSWDKYNTVNDVMNDRDNRYIELAGNRQLAARVLGAMNLAEETAELILTRTTTARIFKECGLRTSMLALRFAINAKETLAHIDEAIDAGASLIVVETGLVCDGTRFTLLSAIEKLSNTYPEVRFIVLTDYEDAQLPSPAPVRFSLSQETGWLFTDTVARLIKIWGVPVLNIFRARELSLSPKLARQEATNSQSDEINAYAI